MKCLDNKFLILIFSQKGVWFSCKKFKGVLPLCYFCIFRQNSPSYLDKQKALKRACFKASLYGAGGQTRTPDLLITKPKNHFRNYLKTSQNSLIYWLLLVWVNLKKVQKRNTCVPRCVPFASVC